MKVEQPPVQIISNITRIWSAKLYYRHQVPHKRQRETAKIQFFLM